jgi:DNA topoisomerase-2
MERLDEDIVALMKKRVYDLAGIFGANVKVILNGQPIKINSFAKYIDLYFAPSANVIKVYDKQMNTPRWEVLVTYSPT